MFLKKSEIFEIFKLIALLIFFYLHRKMQVIELLCDP
jgi:hypothetical protein